MKYSLHIPAEITKIISLNTKYGSLEDPRLRGYVFAIAGKDNSPLGSAKKYLMIGGNSVLKFDESFFDFKISYLETTAEVFGFDVGLPKEMGTKIYVIKNNMIENQRNNNDELPTLLVEKSGKKYYTNYLKINGPLTVIYDLENYHEIGGKVRIETDAELEGISEWFNYI